MKMRILGMAVSCALLAGCAAYKAIDPVMAVNVGDDITVEPQVQWANALYQANTVRLWTIDGFGLDELRFYMGVKQGDPLFQIPGVQRREMGAYNTTMLPDDVMELVSSTLGKAGYQQIRTEGLRPVPFGTITGFRFDLGFTTSDGLLMKGDALFAQRRGKLDLILFMAPSEYYYDRYAPIVERIFGSVRIPDPPPAMASAEPLG
jgi:hypothetical protein